MLVLERQCFVVVVVFLLYVGVGYISAMNMNIISHMPCFSFSQLLFIEELILFHQQESSEVIEVAPRVQNQSMVSPVILQHWLF